MMSFNHNDKLEERGVKPLEAVQVAEGLVRSNGADVVSHALASGS